MKKWLYGLFGLLLFLVFVPKVASAQNKINSIHIDVELHEDGSATIRETRQMETDEHTELYIVLENMRDTDLLDFSVGGFTEKKDWDIEDSFKEKANRYGIIDTDDGYELAWGISEYGTPEYHVQYSLSNLVRNLEDGQALFWNFDSFLTLPTDHLTFTLSGPFPLEDVLIDHYGFGFEGPISFSNGSFVWNGMNLDEENAVTVLLQFPKDTFNTSSSVDMTLLEQREMAKEGSSYNADAPWPLWLKIMTAAGIALGVGGAGLAVWFTVQVQKVYKKHRHFNSGTYLKENKEKMSPTPPLLEGEVGRYSFFISQLFYVGGGFSDYFMAYLLSWSIDQKIIIETREKERQFLKSKIEADIFIQNFEEETEANRLSFKEYVDLFEIGESTLEEIFWSVLLEAADDNGQVTGNGIREWAEENGKYISELMTGMDDVSEKWLVENGYLNVFKEKVSFGSVDIKQVTDKGNTFAHELVKFHNFVKNIKEVNLEEFDDWQALIVWAAVLGQAENMVKYLEEFHPGSWNVVTNRYPTIYGSYVGYQYFYTSTSTGLTNSGYGGSGGSTSSVGGGGGAGGGGGGGSR